MDGNSASWSRLYWTLLSNSVVIKQNSNHMQWYYGCLKPWIHYVPVKNDLSNLEQIINLLEKNDALAHRIAINSTKLIKNNLSPEIMEEFTATLLKKYSETIEIIEDE